MPTAITSSKLTTFFSTSPLPCSSFQYCYQSAQSAYAMHRFRDAEMDLTNAINELTLSCLTTMHLNRAVARGTQGDLNAGLQDAYKVIDLSPKLAEGYLCAGELLKSMGKWTDALHLYNAAMNQAKGNALIRDAQIELQREIDDANAALFRKLPPEIFGTIVGVLHYQDRLQCAATCRAWRSYLLNGLSAMWQELEFIRNIPMDTLEFQLANVNPCQVRSVRLGNNCEPPVTRRILKFLLQCVGIENLGMLVILQ
ncbi:hypothetical protein BJV82DRAFT_273567 [Fennellomyces sp. T-0311]|nr:hypothetical protein BJV82DRAFT_273567 [Fennellomyces sp. T-0311]